MANGENVVPQLGALIMGKDGYAYRWARGIDGLERWEKVNRNFGEQVIERAREREADAEAAPETWFTAISGESLWQYLTDHPDVHGQLGEAVREAQSRYERARRLAQRAPKQAPDAQRIAAHAAIDHEEMERQVGVNKANLDKAFADINELRAELKGATDNGMRAHEVHRKRADDIETRLERTEMEWGLRPYPDDGLTRGLSVKDNAARANERIERVREELKGELDSLAGQHAGLAGRFAAHITGHPKDVDDDGSAQKRGGSKWGDSPWEVEVPREPMAGGAAFFDRQREQGEGAPDDEGHLQRFVSAEAHAALNQKVDKLMAQMGGLRVALDGAEEKYDRALALFRTLEGRAHEHAAPEEKE